MLESCRLKVKEAIEGVIYVGRIKCIGRLDQDGSGNLIGGSEPNIMPTGTELELVRTVTRRSKLSGLFMKD